MSLIKEKDTLSELSLTELKKLVFQAYRLYLNAEDPLEKAVREDQIHNLLNLVSKMYPELNDELMIA